MFFSIFPTFWALALLIVLLIGKEFGAGAILSSQAAALQLKDGGWSHSLNISTAVKGVLNAAIVFLAFGQYGLFLVLGLAILLTVLDYLFDYWKMTKRLPSVDSVKLAKAYNWISGLKAFSLTGILGAVIKLHDLIK